MDIRDLDRRVLAEMDKIVSGLTDLGLRTPCAGWTLGDDPYRAYAKSVDAFLATSADDTVLDREVTVREFGTFPAPVALTMHLVDSVAHGWDHAPSTRPTNPTRRPCTSRSGSPSGCAPGRAPTTTSSRPPWRSLRTPVNWTGSPR